MITLKRLHVSNFKSLQHVDILFPEQGSLLIEGHNEAGKSTLFEAVYVGLYGKPLVGEDERARLEDVIQYNQPKATVELEVSVGQQTLSITRIFERGKPQYATLRIQQPALQPETVNRVRAVDDRILKELGNLDGESLRNSCFVEQKELGRIEALKRTEREQAIHKLLGLERLTQLMDEFKPRREQERELELAEKYLLLAQLQEKARQFSDQEQTLTERLDAIKVAVHLKHLADLAAQKETIEQQLHTLETTIQQAQKRLTRCEALKEQTAHANEIAQSLTDMAHSRRELKRMKDQLARLEQIENVELPAAQAYFEEVTKAADAVRQLTQARARAQDAGAGVREAQRLLEDLQKVESQQQQQAEQVTTAQTRLEQRKREAEIEQQRLAQQLNELAAKQIRLKQALALITQWETACRKLYEIQQISADARTRQQEWLRLQAELQQREKTVQDRKEAADQAEQEAQQAAEALRRATAYGELTTWVRLKTVETALSNFTAQRNALIAQKQAAETLLVAEQSRTRTALFMSIALSVLTILISGVGFLWPLAFLPGVLLLVAALAGWVWFRQRNQRTHQRSHEVNRWNAELRQLDMQRQAAIQTGGDPTALQHHEHQLQAIGMAIPPDLPTAQKLLDDLKRRSDSIDVYQARSREQAAREQSIRLREQQRQAMVLHKESQQACKLAQQKGDPAEQLSKSAVLESEQKRIVDEEEQQARQSILQDSQWPVNSQAAQGLLSVCQAGIRTTTEAQQKHEAKTTLLLQEAQNDLGKAQETFRQIQNQVSQQKESNPASQLAQAQNQASQARIVCKQQEERIQQWLQEINLPSEREVEPARGSAKARVQTLTDELATRPEHVQKCEAQARDLAQKAAQTATIINTLLETARSLSVDELPLFTPPAQQDNSSSTYEEEWSGVLEGARSALQQAVSNLDEPGAKRTRDSALGEQGSLQQQVALVADHAEDHRQKIGSLFMKQSLNAPSTTTQETVVASWPLVVQVTPEEEKTVSEELELAGRELYATRQQENNLVAELRHPGTPLNIEECQQTVDQLREEREIGLHAHKLLKETHDRIARRVLPITERNMQPLLQQLTSGRYRDVRLTPEDINGQPGEMDYRIRVWNPAAGRYVAKNIFSGGTRDQCSLALRLAFALATLPQELGVAPGFIFLDEPLSAFDAQRAQALVELLTTGTIAQQFSQVVLISHYHAFEREAFRYHVRMEAGQIVESDLPSREDQAMLVETVLS